jgi:hypothetical protein
MKYITIKHEDNKSNDLIDTFLSGIGETITTFPPIYQHMAKSKILSIVSDTVMQLLAPTTSITTNPLNIQTSQSANDRCWSHQNYIQNWSRRGLLFRMTVILFVFAKLLRGLGRKLEIT